MPKFTSNNDDKKQEEAPQSNNNTHVNNVSSSDRKAYLEQLKGNMSEREKKIIYNNWNLVINQLRLYGDITKIDLIEYKISMIEQQQQTNF